MSADTKTRGGRAARTVVATASFTALACGICCVLPLAIPAVMLGSAGGILAWFGGTYGMAIPVAIVAVIVSWLWVAYQSRRSSKKPAAATLLILTAATVMTVVALIWPMIEPSITSMLAP